MSTVILPDPHNTDYVHPLIIGAYHVDRGAVPNPVKGPKNTFRKTLFLVIVGLHAIATCQSSWAETPLDFLDAQPTISPFKDAELDRDVMKQLNDLAVTRREFASNPESPIAAKRLIFSLNRAGNFLLVNSREEQALGYLTAGLNISERIFKSNPEIELFTTEADRAVDRYHSGYLFAALKKPQNGGLIEYQLRDVAFWEKSVSAHPKSLGTLRDYAESLNRLIGYTYHKSPENRDLALEVAERASAAFEGAFELDQKSDAAEVLCSLLRWRARIYKDEVGRQGEEVAIELMSRMVEVSKIHSRARYGDFRVADNWIAQFVALLDERGNPADRKKAILLRREEMEIIEKRVNDRRDGAGKLVNGQALFELCPKLHFLGLLYGKEGATEAAVGFFEKELAYVDELVAANPKATDVPYPLWILVEQLEKAASAVNNAGLEKRAQAHLKTLEERFDLTSQDGVKKRVELHNQVGFHYSNKTLDQELAAKHLKAQYTTIKNSVSRGIPIAPSLAGRYDFLKEKFEKSAE